MTKGIHVCTMETAAFRLYYGKNNSGFNFLSIKYCFFCILFVPLFYSWKTVNKIFSCLIFFERHEEMLTSHFEVWILKCFNSELISELFYKSLFFSIVVPLGFWPLTFCSVPGEGIYGRSKHSVWGLRLTDCVRQKSLWSGYRKHQTHL